MMHSIQYMFHAVFNNHAIYSCNHFFVKMFRGGGGGGGEFSHWEGGGGEGELRGKGGEAFLAPPLPLDETLITYTKLVSIIQQNSKVINDWGLSCQ